MSDAENYTLQRRDFVPFAGGNQYFNRNQELILTKKVDWRDLTDEEKSAKLGYLILLGYNLLLGFTPLFVGVKTLEYLLTH